jgi:uncharacterized protein (TIGR02246 family)
MKRILCLYTLFIFVAMVNAQEKSAAVTAISVKPNRFNDTSDKKEILKIVEQWKEGYNSGDAAKVAALYKEDAYYLTQHFITGIVRGRAAIQAYVQLGVDSRYHIDSIRTLSIDCSGDFAYAITRYDATNNGQIAFGVNIVVLKKIGGKWLIVAHEAAVPDRNTAIQRLDTAKSH